VARCTVFPSLNEGFGLPVAESLACGTPVVTSDFGSMAEIAADGGALLANPREDHSIAAALRTLLVDDAEHARLSQEARQRPTSSWDDYAARVWSTLVTHEPIGG
jgi:glycosyltransferase involved in cell wall biosynthesis